MIQKLINQSKGQDVLFLSGAILSMLNKEEYGDDPRKSVLPEMFSTLGLEGTINLIKFFGGETIHIPSHEEMWKSFLIIVAFYKKKVEGKSWEEIKDELGIDINPHTLGKSLQNVESMFNLEMEDLKALGIDKIMEKIKEPRGE